MEVHVRPRHLGLTWLTSSHDRSQTRRQRDAGQGWDIVCRTECGAGTHHSVSARRSLGFPVDYLMKIGTLFTNEAPTSTQLCRQYTKFFDMATFARTNTSSIVNPLFLLRCAISIAAAQTTAHFNITAISATNGRSTIECWQITRPFDISHDPGTAGTKSQQLGDLTNMTFTILPPNFDGGLHNAQFVQYVTCPTSCTMSVIPMTYQIRRFRLRRSSSLTAIF
jgi:hypothetical protein